MFKTILAAIPITLSGLYTGAKDLTPDALKGGADLGIRMTF
jgi:hypothetical protein